MIRYKALPDFLIENRTRGLQRHPAVATCGAGFVVAWTDDVSPACEVGGPDVRAKLFSSAGEPVQQDFRVNSETIDQQRDPKVVGLSGGRFAVVWQDFSGRGGDPCCGGIKARLFDRNGVAVHDEFLVNVETANRQFNATLTSLAGGNLAMAWQAYALANRQGSGVRARLFGPEGKAVSNELSVSVGSDARQESPSIAGLVGGHFVVVWNDRSAGIIKGKVFNSSGKLVHAEFAINSDKLTSKADTSAVGLSDGGFAIVWSDHGSPGSTAIPRIKVRLFHPDGTPSSKELSVDAGSLGGQDRPALAALPGGGLVLVWAAYLAPVNASKNSEIKVAVLAPNARSTGWSRALTNHSTLKGSSPTVAGLANGGFVVVCEEVDNHSTGETISLKGQIFHPN